MPIYGYMQGPSEFTITGTLKDYDETARLHLIDAPTLFTAGEFDEVLPSSAEHYRSLMPHAEMSIIPGSGHLTMHDEPERYIGAVREFLRRQDSPRK